MGKGTTKNTISHKNGETFSKLSRQKCLPNEKDLIFSKESEGKKEEKRQKCSCVQEKSVTLLPTSMRLPAKILIALCVFLASGIDTQVCAKDRFARIRLVDSVLTARYRNANVDTAYVTRPTTRFTIIGRANVSGAQIGAEAVRNDIPFQTKLKADYKSTLSLAVNYVGFSVSVALNPAKLLGRYSDYELNLLSYGKSFGFEFIYHSAHNFKGWSEEDGQNRVNLPPDILSLKTLNLNGYYCFNNRRFSYPAALSQGYIQRRSAGSFLLALSAQGQRGEANSKENFRFNITNIGVGGGYGYNYVPAKNWLIHLSSLPTFIVFSNTALTLDNTRIPLRYHFPEVILTARGSVVRQIKRNMFTGLSMVFNFTNIGNKKNLEIENTKWRARFFYGIRL